MLKKILSVILAGTMVLSLAACGGTANNEETGTADGTEISTETDAAGTEAEEKATIKVGMVTDTGGVNDGSFNQSSWAGLQKAGEELGIEVNYLESKNDSDYAANIETFIDEECDLIIGVGFMLADAIGKAADENPDQKFAIIDDSANADKPNVACLMFEQAQASYLVGYVAGLTTESNNVGFVLGMASPVMHEFGYGFTAGVLDANPEATVQMSDANSFGDPAQGKSNATAMITGGADVIFHAAGGTGLGVIEACKEANIKAIGVDSDQSALAPENIITSALKRVDNASYDIAKAVLEGTYAPGVIVYDLSTSGVDYVASDLLADDVKTAVEDVKAKILSGEIVVPKTQADFEAKHGDAYTLD